MAVHRSGYRAGPDGHGARLTLQGGAGRPRITLRLMQTSTRERAMRDYLKFYINGEWVDPAGDAKTLDVLNPATDAVAGRISMGSAADVDRAAKAAKAAFRSFSRTSRAERLELLQAVLAEYQKRIGDVAEAITEEMGAPAWLSKSAQAAIGAGHLHTAI